MSLVLTGTGVTYPNGQTQTAPFPAGMVCHFANVTAPDGWLECNGSAVSRTTYAALFAAIGTVYGAGNGSTTFNLPDLRGEFVRGWDNGRGVDPGRAIGSSQTNQIQAHNHNQVTPTANNTSGAVLGHNRDYSNTQSWFEQGSYVTGNTGGSETRPRNVAMMPCIKT